LIPPPQRKEGNILIMIRDIYKNRCWKSIPQKLVITQKYAICKIDCINLKRPKNFLLPKEKGIEPLVC